MASVAASVVAADALAAAVLGLERARMRLEDVQSWAAQRHWVNSLQVPETGRRMTWESLFRMRHNDLVHAHSALEQVRDLLNQDDAQAALEVALDVVGHAAEPSEQSEESPLDDNRRCLCRTCSSSCWKRCSRRRRPLSFRRLAAAASDWTCDASVSKLKHCAAAISCDSPPHVFSSRRVR